MIQLIRERVFDAVGVGIDILIIATPVFKKNYKTCFGMPRILLIGIPGLFQPLPIGLIKQRRMDPNASHPAVATPSTHSPAQTPTITQEERHSKAPLNRGTGSKKSILTPGVMKPRHSIGCSLAISAVSSSMPFRSIVARRESPPPDQSVQISRCGLTRLTSLRSFTNA